jgi:PAS domain-containing protein
METVWIKSVIDQLRAERVRQQEQSFLLEQLIETSPVGIIMLDLDRKITAINPSAAQLLGIDATQVFRQPLFLIDKIYEKKIRFFRKVCGNDFCILDIDKRMTEGGLSCQLFLERKLNNIGERARERETSWICYAIF